MNGLYKRKKKYITFILNDFVFIVSRSYIDDYRKPYNFYLIRFYSPYDQNCHDCDENWFFERYERIDNVS